MPAASSPTHDELQAMAGRPAIGTISMRESSGTAAKASSTTSSLKTSRKESRIGTFPWLKRTGTDCTALHGRKHGWRPVTTRKRVLIPFAITSLVIAGVIEILAQRVQRNGGLALSSSTDNIPSLARFSYLFLPTIIAVIYSIAWSWIDLDVKRITPWLMLSSEEGATAENSLLLDYPYDFIAFVPFKAAKRRHWPVVISGTMVMIIFWILTPLQSAIFGSGPVIIARPATFTPLSQLIALDKQAEAIDPTILNTAFTIKYLQQQYPPFTTPEYTLQPFTLQNALDSTEARNWTIATTKYYTDIQCWPAEVGEGILRQGRFNFFDGEGCYYSISYKGISETIPYKLSYISHHSATRSRGLVSPNICERSGTKRFLAAMMAWNEDHPNRPELTAIFCSPSYWQQRVTVTVSNGNFVPDSDTLIPLGPPEPLPTTAFNSTGLEYLLGTGFSAVKIERDYPATRHQNHENRLNRPDLDIHVDPLAGFAINANESLRNLLNTTVLEDRFRSVHKSMFALTFSYLQQGINSQEATTLVGGSQTFILRGVIVSRVFSAIVEVILLIIALSAIGLHLLCLRFDSNLTYDPASLGDLIAIVRNSKELLRLLAGKDDMDEKQLRRAFGEQDLMFKLQCRCQSLSDSMSIAISRTSGSQILPIESVSLNQPSVRASAGYYTPVRPLILRKEMGAMFTSILLGILTGLLYLKLQEQHLGGLSRPSQRFEVLQFLESYIPTIIATLLEPYWVLVNRLLCVLQPFQDLWSGKQRARFSIDAKYTSLPPQLVAWWALRSRHFLLALVCAVALLSNILAVAFGGLFNEKPVRVPIRVDLQASTAEYFTNDSIAKFLQYLDGDLDYIDPFLATSSNISAGLPLPPWTTREYYFRPFAAASEVLHNESDTLTGRTRGYGLEVSCETIKPVSDDQLVISLSDFKERHSIDPRFNCADMFDAMADFWVINELIEGGGTGGPFAVENPMRGNCANIILSMYGRAPNAAMGIGNIPVANLTANTTITACHPEFKTALFDVTVGIDSRVILATRATDLESDLDYPQSASHTDSLVAMALTRWTGIASWHNDTIARNWMDFLIKVASNSTAFLDPLEPPPDADKQIIPYMKDLLQRQFALLMAFNSFVLPEASSAAGDETNQNLSFAGTLYTTETRIFMSEEAFIASVTVLVLNVIVAVVIYSWAVKFFLPRMPTTIGSAVAYLAPSRALRLYEEGNKSSAETFRFGRYVGDDGKAHVGIEISEFVVPVDLMALKRGDTRGASTFGRWVKTRLMKGRGKSQEPWL